MNFALALAIIVKDELDLVKNIIDKYGKYFDEICLAVDKNHSEFHDAFYTNDKVKVFAYTWIDDFAHKRNFIAGKVAADYYFRMDCDDLIENPEKIREVFNVMTDKKADVLFVPYHYHKDEAGNCNTKHWRETIIKKKPGIYWKKAIHENIFAEKTSEYSVMKSDFFKIIHNIDDQHAWESNERNFKLLMKEFEQDKENTDPRTISYIGRVLFGRGEYKRAIPFLQLLIQLSGWDDDKYFAWIHLAECYHCLNNDEMSHAACNEALEINTTYPDAYIKKGVIYLKRQEFQKALDWIMPGLVRKEPDTNFVVDPTLYTYRVRIFAALAFLGNGDYENMFKYFKEAKQFSPNADFVKDNERLIIEAYDNYKYFNNFKNLYSFVKSDNDRSISLIRSIPDKYSNDERTIALKLRHYPPKVWEDKSIVFYCGQAWEDWADPSVLNGIGGSEEAVIYLSRELAKIGWKVTVYNSCGDMAGTYNGVDYRDYREFNPNDYFHCIVAWRNNIFPSMKQIKTKKRLVWLHDLPLPDQFECEVIEWTFDKAIVLSKYHRSFLEKWLMDVNLYVSSNGINQNDFLGLDGIERNPHRMIYTSSYDRGLQHTLVYWSEIRKEVPDAELHIFYGWDTYLKMESQGLRPKQWRVVMQNLMKQDGVFEHGRIGHKQLAKELAKSSIWIYQSSFEEISCISAMKAQEAGCIPVCTNYGALQETVKKGILIDGKAGNKEVDEKFKEELIKILKDEKRQEELRKEIAELKGSFSWAKVADDWDKNLLQLKPFEFKDLDEYTKFYQRINAEVKHPIQENYIPPRFDWARKFIIEHPEIKTGIDLATFDGNLPVYLKRQLGNSFSCDAMDIKEQELDFAKKLNKQENLGISFYSGTPVERFNNGKKYDVVFFMEALEHCIKPEDVINNIRNIMQDGGYLLMTVPYLHGIYGEKDFLYNATHLRAYTVESLKEQIPDWIEIKECFLADELVYFIGKKNV